MEEKVVKNGNNGSIFLGILLVVVILCFAGYVLFDQGIINFGSSNSDNVKEETSEQVNDGIELDVNSIDVRYLYSMTKYSYYVNQEVYGSKKLTVSEMSDSYKQNITSSFYAGRVYGQQTLGSQVAVDAADVKDAYDFIFGEGYYKKDLTAKYQCLDLKYDVTSNKYIGDWIPCGFISAEFDREVPLKAVKYDDRIEITVGVVFVVDDVIYGDFEKTRKLDGSISGRTDGEFLTLVNNNINSVSQYTYTFKLNKNGFYNYYSVERTKN